jgi:hypothetical protein
MVDVQAPAKSRSREQARQLMASLPRDLAHTRVRLDCRNMTVATPSFADEILKEVLLRRHAQHLDVTNAPGRFAELLERAAARLAVNERVDVATPPALSRRTVI